MFVFFHLWVAVHSRRDAVHQLIDDVDHPVGRDHVRLDDHTFLPAAMDTDFSLWVLEETKRDTLIEKSLKADLQPSLSLLLLKSQCFSIYISAAGI